MKLNSFSESHTKRLLSLTAVKELNALRALSCHPIFVNEKSNSHTNFVVQKCIKKTSMTIIITIKFAWEHLKIRTQFDIVTQKRSITNFGHVRPLVLFQFQQEKKNRKNITIDIWIFSTQNWLSQVAFFQSKIISIFKCGGPLKFFWTSEHTVPHAPKRRKNSEQKFWYLKM